MNQIGLFARQHGLNVGVGVGDGVLFGKSTDTFVIDVDSGDDFNATRLLCHGPEVGAGNAARPDDGGTNS